jgi:hypothetical protein
MVALSVMAQRIARSTAQARMARPHREHQRPKILTRHREPPLGGVAIQGAARTVLAPWIASSLRSSQ